MRLNIGPSPSVKTLRDVLGLSKADAEALKAAMVAAQGTKGVDKALDLADKLLGG